MRLPFSAKHERQEYGSVEPYSMRRTILVSRRAGVGITSAFVPTGSGTVCLSGSLEVNGTQSEWRN